MTNADNGGSLIGEIIRGISTIYGWNINQPETIEKYDISESDLTQYSGTYLAEISGFGPYTIEVRVNGKDFEVHDQIEGTIHFLVPTSALDFRDQDQGTSARFVKNEAGTVDKLVWAEQFTFTKQK